VSDRDPGRARAEAHLAEILALTLMETGVIDRDALCDELEALASARRDDGADETVVAGLVSLAVSLRAGRSF
jgi:hypothetical protein